MIEGSVRLGSVDANVVSLPHEEIFRRAFDEEAYDVAELSLANFIVTSAAGRCPYSALPIFTSRMFRHAAIYIRTDRGISRPVDLKGKTVGLREFSNTATVTVKGILSDDHDVRQSDILWRYGPVNPDEATPVIRRIPSGINATAVDKGECLSQLLAQGELDAVVAYTAPRCFEEKHPKVTRLFPDYRSAEMSYFKRSGIFPIMHLLGVRKALAGEAALCVDICETFECSKRQAFARLVNTHSPSVMLPWSEVFVEDVQRTMGFNYWPYGLARNKAPLDAILRWLTEQDLIETTPSRDSLFAGSVTSWEPDALRNE